MLSILIPTYNYDLSELLANLNSQIESVDEAVQVLICDDASPDKQLAGNNQKLANQLGFEYKKNTNNLGRTATRDLLAKTAQYEWLLFLDADVLPVKENYLSIYVENLSDEADVIAGGIAYSKEKPGKVDQRLRWYYGHKKEVKSAAERRLQPHIVVSANLLVRKTIFSKCNPAHDKGYGLDNIFSECLKMCDARVKHLDNPVFHLGLESNQAFVQKSLESIDNTLRSELKGEIEPGSRPIQRAYLRLKKFGMLPLFKLFAAITARKAKNNLRAKNPSIFWFDIYRLHYYITNKK